MSSLYQIEKLDDKNYDCWCIQMQSVLIHSEVWGVVSGTFDRAANESVWAAQNQKALATIILCVKPSQLNFIKNCTNASDAWVRLKEIYKPSGPARKVTLYKKLLGLRMAEGVSMAQYINMFTDIVEKLAEVSIEIKEELLVIILLSSLPKNYENFVIAMETRDNLPPLKVLKVKLLEEGERRSEEGQDGGDQLAFYANSNKRSNKFNNYRNSNNNNNNNCKKFNGIKQFSGSCFKCGQRGHLVAKCDVKRNDEKPTTTKQQFSFTLLAAAETQTLNSFTWCLDSGATAHMCSEKSLFVK